MRFRLAKQDMSRLAGLEVNFYGAPRGQALAAQHITRGALRTSGQRAGKVLFPVRKIGRQQPVAAARQGTLL